MEEGARWVQLGTKLPPLSGSGHRGYHSSVARVGDRERERAAASLQDHFVKGRLSLEELGTRIELALDARTRSDVRASLRDLPAQWQRSNEIVAAGASMIQRGARILVFFATVAAWAICSAALAVPFTVLAVALGPSTLLAAVFVALWGLMSVLLWRPWFRLRRSAGRPARS